MPGPWVLQASEDLYVFRCGGSWRVLGGFVEAVLQPRGASSGLLGKGVWGTSGVAVRGLFGVCFWSLAHVLRKSPPGPLRFPPRGPLLGVVLRAAWAFSGPPPHLPPGGLFGSVMGPSWEPLVQSWADIAGISGRPGAVRARKGDADYMLYQFQ